jgi:kumamolisin
VKRRAAFVTCLLFVACAPIARREPPVGAPARTVRDRFLGLAAPGEPVGFSLVLRRPHPAETSRYLSSVDDPSSPLFHRYLSPAAFGARFGLSRSEIHHVGSVLASNGLRVVASFPQRTALQVHGTAGSVERLFGVRLGDYRDPRGRLVHAPLGEAHVPASLRSSVEAVAGLDDRAVLHPAVALSDIPVGGLKPSDVAAAYDIAPLHTRGGHGEGQTVAVLSFGTFAQSSIDAFDQRMGIQGPAVQHVSVDGGTNTRDLEVNLDIEVIRGIAPAAQILDYEAPNTLGAFADIINRIVADGRADIVSVSWGLCDDLWPHDTRLAVQRAIDAAIARGISIFVASGDAGAFECQSSRLSDHRPSVSWPSDSSGVISVGGTLLSLRSDGSYGSEAGWEDVLSFAGSGGGLNPLDGRPSWQVAPGVQNEHSNGLRQIPDVAAAADPESGFAVVFDDPKRGLVSGQVGGTSAATPLWAASMVLVKQAAAKQGVARLGFVDPILYALASSPQPAPPFHDVTRGGNRLFAATLGWDYVTGLGSPDVANLATDMIAYLKTHPAPRGGP